MSSNRAPAEVKSRLDFWQALSGAVLALFISVHLVLEGSVVLSPVITNGIGWLLEATYIAHIAAPVLVLIIIAHFIIAARKMPFRCGEFGLFVRHSARLKDADTALWIVQVVTAIVILAGAFSHVFTVMTSMPIEVSGSAARLHEGWIFFHAVFLPCVILHTGIGVYRLAVKFGICSKAKRDKVRMVIWIVMGCYLLLGACALTRVWFLG